MAEEGSILKPKLFSSTFNIPYSKASSLNTVDLHFPINTLSPASLWLIYLHGGAFRDPLVDSTSIIPTLSHLFDSTSSHLVYGVASLNYRLSPYPSHPTSPSSPGDPARNARWPDYLEDVKLGIHWVLENGENFDPRAVGEARHSKSRAYILAGHSVGGTMTLKVAQSQTLPFPHPVAALSLCGIYDFAAARDAHPSNRQIYDDFTDAAFGPEAEGNWDKGSTRTDRIRNVTAAVLAHSKTDTLVEWEQTNVMSEVLGAGGPGVKSAVMEIQGDHREIYEKGVEVARAVKKTLQLLHGVS